MLVVLMGYICFIFYKYQERKEEVAKYEVDNPFRIVTSFYPMYLQTTAITEGASGIEVVNMANNQVGCLHDYTLTTEDVKKLSRADVLIINGLGEEHFIEKVYQQNEGLHIIDASSQWIEWYENHYEGHPTEAFHEENQQEGHEGHEHGPINTHVWLSIQGAKLQLQAIAEKLSQLNPENATIYQENLERMNRELAVLQVDNGENKGGHVVSVHDTFQYLAEENGMEVVGIIPEGSYENPSPKKIEAIIKLIKEEGVSAILADERYKDLSILGIIQKETACPIQFLDDMTVEKEIGYIERLKRNNELLKEVRASE